MGGSRRRSRRRRRKKWCARSNEQNLISTLFLDVFFTLYLKINNSEFNSVEYSCNFNADADADVVDEDDDDIFLILQDIGTNRTRKSSRRMGGVGGEVETSQTKR